MDSIKVRTQSDFENSAASAKRKRHSSIACARCRKLKIRCHGGQSSVQSPNAVSNPCSHCAEYSRECEWPEEDGRKQKRQRAASDQMSQPIVEGTAPWIGPSSGKSQSNVNDQQSRDYQNGTSSNTMSAPNQPRSPRSRGLLRQVSNSESKGSDSPVSEPPYYTVQYYRHLGPTAIAPGHKQISLKARQDDIDNPGNFFQSNNSRPDPHMAITHDPNSHLQLFDEATGLPSDLILPPLLDAFFEYYGDNYCFLNQTCLRQIIDHEKPPVFLVCTMCALSSRFCPESFSHFLPPAKREAWEYSAPFLERAKQMVVPSLSLPCLDSVAALLMMAFVDFGDNNESGLWMYTGMAMRMAQELGLHREPSCLEAEKTQPKFRNNPNDRGHANRQLSERVDRETFKQSSEVLLFWSVFTHDTCLCNGTGRVPSLKRHEINIRFPTNDDLAIVRAGPGGLRNLAVTEVYPELARMMLSIAQSIDFLNTGASQIRFQTQMDDTHRMERIDELKNNMIEEYKLIPKEIQFGAVQYKAAVKAHQAGPYLLLHLEYQLQIVFLTQESLADDEDDISIDEIPVSDAKKANQELYRSAIKAITDMLTFAKLIDHRPLLTVVYLNQAFFHAACAYSRDMLRGTANENFEKDLSPSAFPIPSQTSPSMVFPQYPQDNFRSRKGSQEATASTYNFLALIARTNHQFLRQAIKDQTAIYAGSGWVNNLLDQRETGLRDVDLTVVSDSISTFIRLHDLQGPGASEAALRKFAPAAPYHEQQTADDTGINNTQGAEFAPNFFEDLSFDPQAFFDRYMFSELTSEAGYGGPSLPDLLDPGVHPSIS